MLLVALLIAFGVTVAPPARASGVESVTLTPTEDLSLPFWCDWGYDWDERCYRDDSERLGVGGVDDKVWRAALRFSFDAIPPGASISNAELSTWYDGNCVAPRKTLRPCTGRGYQLDAHPILTPRWLAEREVEIGALAGGAVLEPFAPSSFLVWDLTDLVADWRSGAQANNGVLIKLADGQEDFDSSGPAFPSSPYPDASVRPRLTVWYVQD
jgi:hypothetical protein